jgi:hypothetical protein
MPTVVGASSSGIDAACRLVQIGLALYLLPAFLIVLLVGGVGMLVIAVIRLFADLPGKTVGSTDPLLDGSVCSRSRYGG